jgi:hypothetical protein
MAIPRSTTFQTVKLAVETPSGTTGTNLMVTLETVTNTRTKWRIRGRIIRSATSTEKSVVVWHTSGAAAAATNMDVVTTLNQVNTTATPLRITGQATANNDIVLEGIIIGWDDQNS